MMSLELGLYNLTEQVAKWKMKVASLFVYGTLEKWFDEFSPYWSDWFIFFSSHQMN